MNWIVLSVDYNKLFHTPLATYTCCTPRVPAHSYTQHHQHRPFTEYFRLPHVTKMTPSCYLLLSYSVDWLQTWHRLDWPSARYYCTLLSRRVSKCPSVNRDQLLVWLSVVREWNCWKAYVLPNTAVILKPKIWAQESLLLASRENSLAVLTQKTSDQN
jgi:hypothetical protein